jgi:hypothetical protein
MSFKILKQLIPTGQDSNEPSWAKREVWVSKLDDNDTIDEFETQQDAESRKSQLESSDPTNRLYKIVEV